MAIKYSLVKNKLKDDPDEYKAAVVCSYSADLNEMIERMIQMGSTATKADMLAVMTLFKEALVKMLAEGKNVKLPFANYKVSIKGNFRTGSDVFDPHRHRVCVNVSPGKELRQFFKKGLAAEKISAAESLPLPLEFIDHVTGSKNNVITPGGLAQLNGYRLKINLDEQTEGIYLADSSNSLFKVETIGQNYPGSLMFTIPAEITPGKYLLEIKTKTGSARLAHKLTAG